MFLDAECLPTESSILIASSLTFFAREFAQSQWNISVILNCTLPSIYHYTFVEPRSHDQICFWGSIFAQWAHSFCQVAAVNKSEQHTQLNIAKLHNSFSSILSVLTEPLWLQRMRRPFIRNLCEEAKEYQEHEQAARDRISNRRLKSQVQRYKQSAGYRSNSRQAQQRIAVAAQLLISCLSI